MTELAALLAHAQRKPAEATHFQPLVDALLDRYDPEIRAIILYGACRSSVDTKDGLVDVCVVVNNYQRTLGHRFSALANHWIPPNVYYISAGALRSKYIIVSQDTLKNKMSSVWDHYFWARFAQPFQVLYLGKPQMADQLVSYQQMALTTFFQNLLAVQGQVDVPLSFWANGLRRTYASELRPESLTRADELIAKNADFWLSITPLLQQQNQSSMSHQQKWLQWMLRRWLGKLFNLIRLVKASFTFTGGLDYVAWKVERHSGTPVPITPWMRHHPRLAGFKLAWQLLRSGAVR